MTKSESFTRMSPATPARAASILVAVVMAAVAGLMVGAAPARADHLGCVSASCNGLWPHDEGCAGGTALENRYFLPFGTGDDPRAAIQLRHNAHCGTARWARMVWDGPPSGYPPARFNFKVERQVWYIDQWLSSLVQTRTTQGGEGVWVTRMAAGGTNRDARHRACARYGWSTGFDDDGNLTWGSYSGWTCTAWQVGPA